MGEVVVSGLVTLVIEKLSSVLLQEFGLLKGFKDSVESIKHDFIMIEAVLEDAEKKGNKEKAVELWLQRLRSVSMEVENVLDEISTEALIRRLRKERGFFRYRMRRKVSLHRVRTFFTSNKLVFRDRIAHEVKDLKEKLDAITLQSQRFGLRLTPSSSVNDTGVVGVMPTRETSSLIHDSSSIFGRDEEVEMVTEKICNNDIGKYDNGEILVYGIWGIGGMGKTTLAQLVYNHQMLDQCFDLKCWVYVSENFQVKEIIKKILESLKESNDDTQLETLQSSLQDKLRGKKFLVVLDDVWIEEDEKVKWEELTKTLSCGKEGSIVLTTTRSRTTSNMMAKVPELQHPLGSLSKEDSWLLFTKFAFAQGRVGDDMSLLQPIGEEIVEKCQRLPLAVKTLGSLLWSKRSATEWEHVKSSIQWQLQESKVLPALKLSYDNLLPHLKRCFAYCCLFPKGYEMEKDVLIQLWVSNGFIPPRGELDLYVLGEESFNCLLWRSFFQSERDWFGKECYKMHDLMHDMAEDVMRYDCLVMDPACNDVKIPNEVLHFSSSSPDFLFSPQKKLHNLTQLRSLLMLLGRYRSINSESGISQIFNHVYLRALYLPGIDLETLPESICNLKLLKYLNLSHSRIVELPESIIYLQNLQVLVLHGCDKLCKLPEGLRYMRGLQHLDIRGCTSLRHLPIGGLTSLRRLLPAEFPVIKERGSKIEELGDLNLLVGELEIRGLVNVEGLSEAKSANLISKTNLSLLTLDWSKSGYYRESGMEVVKYEEVLEGLEPNVCLEELQIKYCMGKIISPSWMVSLRNLVRIYYYKCNKCEHIPALGRLPNLRFIMLWDMDSFKCFNDNEKSMLGGTTNDMFLSLQELFIEDCPNLVSLPSNLPSIRKLELKWCSKLLSLPDEIQSFKDLNQLTIEYCSLLSERYEKEKGVDWPKISHIPNIHIIRSAIDDERR